MRDFGDFSLTNGYKSFVANPYCVYNVIPQFASLSLLESHATTIRLDIENNFIEAILLSQHPLSIPFTPSSTYSPSFPPGGISQNTYGVSPL